MNPSQQFTRRGMLTAATAGGAAVFVGRQTLAGEADKGSALRIVDPHVHVWKNDPKVRPNKGKSLVKMDKEISFSFCVMGKKVTF